MMDTTPHAISGRPERARATAVVVGVLLSTWVITATLVWYARAEAQRSGATRFANLVDRATAETERRLALPLLGLHSIAGLYAASQAVEPDEFDAFVARYDREHDFPGVVAFGLLERAGVEGAFRIVHAVPDRPEVRALEGEEAWSAAIEPVVERALASGQAVVTRPLSLSGPGEPGMALLYGVPIDVATADGGPGRVLYALVRVDRMFADIERVSEGQIDIDLFHDDPVRGPTLLLEAALPHPHRHDLDGERLHADRAFHARKDLPLGGRRFGLVLTSLPDFEAGVHGAAPTVLGLGGVLVSIFLVVLLWMMEHARGRAIALAREMTRDLALARQRADLANAAKSAFLANMSHEIRTPLTSMLGYVELLDGEDGERSAEERHEFVRTVRMAGEHLLAVVSDVLDLSKVEAGLMLVESIETPVLEIVSDVARLMEPRAREKGIELAVDLRGSVPERIFGDPTRFRQVLVNLLGNAVKFTERGRVTVSLGVERGPGGSRLLLDVSDTGPGIPAERAESLFAPFTQVDASVTRRFGGTGLGLALCRRLSELLGGTVELRHSEVGVGSCFRFALPLSVPEGARFVDDLAELGRARAESAAPSRLELEGRILLVEDNDANRRLIAHHLRNAGAEVEDVENGRVALETIAKRERQGMAYDLILTDVQMPEIDGYTLTRTLRERGCSLPIVALTAHALAEDREECMAAGCSDHLTKPIDKRSLVESCARWLPGSSARTAAPTERER